MIRTMTESDLLHVVELSRELGYPAPIEELRARFVMLTMDAGTGLFVAERAGAVIGFIQVGTRVPLESPVHCEIIALSITGRAQRTGAGRALVARAVTFTKERGITALRVRSNVMRDVSHVFYTQLGFEKKKTQHVYELPVIRTAES